MFRICVKSRQLINQSIRLIDIVYTIYNSIYIYSIYWHMPIVTQALTLPRQYNMIKRKTTGYGSQTYKFVHKRLQESIPLYPTPVPVWWYGWPLPS